MNAVEQFARGWLVGVVATVLTGSAVLALAVALFFLVVLAANDNPGRPS